MWVSTFRNLEVSAHTKLLKAIVSRNEIGRGKEFSLICIVCGFCNKHLLLI